MFMLPGYGQIIKIYYIILTFPSLISNSPFVASEPRRRNLICHSYCTCLQLDAWSHFDPTSQDESSEIADNWIELVRSCH